VSCQYACCPVVAETIVGMVLDASVRLDMGDECIFVEVRCLWLLLTN